MKLLSKTEKPRHILLRFELNNGLILNIKKWETGYDWTWEFDSKTDGELFHNTSEEEQINIEEEIENAGL